MLDKSISIAIWMALTLVAIAIVTTILVTLIGNSQESLFIFQEKHQNY